MRTSRSTTSTSTPRRPAPTSSTGTGIRWASTRTPTCSATNAGRGRLDLEYELLDTGIFDDDRFVDVDVEYAKAAPDDIHVRVTLSNRGAAPADAAPAPDAVVPQHLVDGRTEGRPRRRRRSASSRSAIRSSASSSCAAKANRNCCSPRTRRTPNACGARPTPPRSSRTRSTASSSTARPTPSTPTGRAPRRPPTTSSRVPAGGAATVGLRLCRPGAKAAKPKAVEQGVRRPDRRGRRVLRLHHAGRPRPPIRCRSCARHSPGCCGASSSTSSTWTAGSRSTTPIRCATAPGPSCATAAGST